MDLERFRSKIITIQGQQVILDYDVALLYGVQTKEVNQAVKNNPDKFPEGYYNMDVLIFLSYRIGTREAKIFRDFINDSFREHVRNKNKPQRSKIVWISSPCYN